MKKVIDLMKDYQISKMYYYCKLLANSLAMITEFLKMSVYEISVLLCQNKSYQKLQNIDKFPIRYK